MPELTTGLGGLLLWAAIGYLLGSVPYGIIVARALNLGNLRDIGSGNIGATNVLRTGNKKAAALTLLFDAGKGVVAVLLARALAGEDAAQVAALAAFLGHCFPVWLGFKGGKGVATHLGMMWALAWPIGLACCLTWLIVAAVFRYSSLAALLAAGFAPAFAVFMDYGDFVVLFLVLAVLVYIRHAENIARLRAGIETKIGSKKSE
ncbi:MAG: glycerol-3-phosphate acyltransferase PlsY [Yoonia sp.]|jgi:glycerol-3-phosphate acyltransferase PlsY